MRPSDLPRLRTVADPQLHPDGRRVAFVVAQADLDDDRYVRRIWLWDGQRARSYTTGPSDGAPRWSPDGRWLAFVRTGTGDGAAAQLHVLPADGGEGRQLTDLPLGVSAVAWAPDSQRLVVAGTTWRPELAELDDDERNRRPKRITRLPFRGDTIGWVHDRRTHLYVVPVDAESAGVDELSCLTPGDEFDESSPSWHPDGRSIAFLSARHDDREIRPGEQAFVLPVDDDGQAAGEPTAVGDVAMWTAIDHAADGTLWLTGLSSVWGWPGPSHHYRVEDGEPRAVTGHVDRSVEPGAPSTASVAPQVTASGILSLLEDRGRVAVVRFEQDGGEPEQLVAGDRCVTGFAARPDGTAFAFTATSPSDPGELWWWEDGEEKVLTDLNASFRDEVALRPVERFTYETDGGEVDGWLVLPEGDGPFPLLLNIHGGPTSQYGDYFFDEFQVYAAAGYGVVATNPRGSSGQGLDWARAVVGTWHELDSPDMRDLRAAADAALARSDRLDPQRLGVMGGSYGGFATARLTAVEDRWRSAIVERGLLAWTSFAGTSDIGPYFDRMFLGASLHEDPARLTEASPVSVAHRTTTPTLVLHSEDDFRCPIEQAEQYFAILRRQGVDSELVRFPGESHELSRSGAPKHRVDRFEVILDWLERTLR